MSHHWTSGPTFTFPRGDARLDMTDLYAFPKATRPGQVNPDLNVHPSWGGEPSGADNERTLQTGRAVPIQN
jgi:hypothetical protein